MSFLNSVISSINGGQSASPSPAPPGQSRTPLPPPKRAGTPNGGATVINAAPTLKRKSEEADNNARPKVARLASSNNLALPSSASATAPPARQPASSSGNKAIAYRGTTKSATNSPAPTPAPIPRKTMGTSAAPAVIAPKSAVPKSGYLATLERAKAAQEAAKQMGQIKHVRREKLSRRDRDRIQAEAAAAAKDSATATVKRPIPTTNSRGKSADPVITKGADVKKDRKPIEVGYKGTIRPTSSGQPSYRGKMPGKPTEAGAGQRGYGDNARKTGYGKYSEQKDEDEEDDEDEEAEEDFESGSSDMEAGLDDLDQEELRSARIARREDELAMKEENELKKQKLERKRRLERLQAEAAARKKRY